MHQLGSDKKRYEGMLAWKQKKVRRQHTALMQPWPCDGVCRVQCTAADAGVVEEHTGCWAML